MKAFILAGGFGTRLQSIIKDVPKPMASINGMPFLALLIDYLKLNGVTQIILGTHYLHEKIQDYFRDSYNGVPIEYIREKKPLGTGGAIVNCIKALNLTEPFMVLNGDTFVKIDHQKLYASHLGGKSDLTIALRKVENCARYGAVSTDQHLSITSFNEKESDGEGFINAGVYIISPRLFENHSLQESFSFEQDFLYPLTSKLIQPQGFITENYFIDIGIAGDYYKACEELPQIIKSG